MLHLVPRSLQYIEQVALLGSIQAASRELGISASAIHRQIKVIEETLGEALFERDARGMVATPTGRLVLALARDWRLENAKVWSAIQANRGVELGHVRIAAMDGMVNGLLPALVTEIARCYARVETDIEIASPDSAVKGVLNGDFDLAFVVNAAPDKNLQFHWSRDFPLGCIAAPGHPVAAMKSIAFADFVTYPVVFQSAALAIRKLLEASHGWIFENAANAVSVNSIQLMKQLVVSGNFIAVTSEMDAGPEIRAGRLRFVPISDRDLFRQKVGIISNAQIPVSAVVAGIVALAVRLIEAGPDPA